LISQVADEYNLELEGKLEEVSSPSVEPPAVDAADLLARLERLKAPSWILFLSIIILFVLPITHFPTEFQKSHVA